MSTPSKGRAVGKKIEQLMAEGKSQSQAVATALAMQRAGRLTARGGYRPAKKERP